MPSHTPAEVAKKTAARNGLIARKKGTSKAGSARLQKIKQALLRRQRGATPLAFGN